MVSTDYSLQNKNRLTVIDLFCGCGGISLGFQMAGFNVLYGLDNNKDALATFKRNFPGAQTDYRKIEDISIDEIPQSDIIVGGPPCVNFSLAKGSRANVLDGIKLVQAFLRIVYLRKPKYWIMENVPRIGLHLPERIPLKWIGIEDDGELAVPVKKEFDISLFGAPQKRKRLLIGNYPIPEPSLSPLHGLILFNHSVGAVKTLGSVLLSLPDPNSRPKGIEVTDPNYEFSIIDNDLTDHFMNTIMTDQEASRIELAKKHHPYMGRMEFPDDLSKPARTVVSLQMGRETLVIKASAGKYRRATIRECASLQTFPISFKFGGKTTSSRYKQAGNAVPPILTYQIASRILENEGEKKPQKPFILDADRFDEPAERKKTKKRHIKYSSSRTIRIPQKEVRGSRVELRSHGYPKTKWKVSLHIGEGKDNHHVIDYTFSEALEMAMNSLKRCNMPNLTEQFDQMMKSIMAIKMDSSNDIHRCIHETGEYPRCIKMIEEIYEAHFPKKKYSGIDIDIYNPISELNKKKMRIRVIVALPMIKKIEALLE